jgi:chromosome segregation ATPase
MILNRSGRMTVAQLKQRMDARFKTVDQRFAAVDERFEAVDKRFDAVDKRFDVIDTRFDRLTAKMDVGFSSLHDKLNAILRALNTKDDHQQQAIDEHEERLRDLETWRRTPRDIVG